MSIHQPIVLSEEMLLATRFAGATRHPSPLVELWSMPGFLDPGECDVLMRYIDANRRPSQIAYGAADARTSETCAFDPAAPVVQLLDLRLSLLLGIAPTLGEPIQGQRYGQGQEYRLHHDYFEPHHPDAATHAARCGNRTWTAMIYLNQPEEGGETHFAYLEEAFVPRQGTILCWNNIGADGRANRHTLHAGRPVTRGSKYIVTKWYRERDWSAAAPAAGTARAARRRPGKHRR